LRFASAEKDLSEIELCRPVLRVKINRAQKLVIRGVPITDSLTALRALVERYYIARIDLQSAGVGNLRLWILPGIEVGISLSDEFLLSDIGVAGTSGEDKGHH